MARTTRGAARAALGSVLAMVGLTFGWGCGTVKTSSTPRTGTEQLLLTNAWDSALQRVDFRALTGVPCYLKTDHVTAIDQGWVVSSLRQALLMNGVLLREKEEQAQWIVEARVGAYGTDDHNWMLGIPQVTVPPSLPGIPAGTVPEMPLVKSTKQQGVAKLAVFAYDRASGRIVWTSGTMLAFATAKDVYIGPVGPIQSGSIRDGAELAGVKIPTAPIPGQAPKPAPPATSTTAPSDPSSMRLPAGATDLEFAP
jgi:hypothetical protein